ncbi:uncharacterized protein LOC131953008 [Physella acuta]|uniref:uncharacterized protein LOC131953008 n=1 Tax=Physella acuta TaxID=109671 RepID=UPI0027DD608B|nr:uncharacterized protein LOC131953008 [Physella acuta]
MGDHFYQQVDTGIQVTFEETFNSSIVAATAMIFICVGVIMSLFNKRDPVPQLTKRWRAIIGIGVIAVFVCTCMLFYCNENITNAVRTSANQLAQPPCSNSTFHIDMQANCQQLINTEVQVIQGIKPTSDELTQYELLFLNETWQRSGLEQLNRTLSQLITDGTIVFVNLHKQADQLRKDNLNFLSSIRTFDEVLDRFNFSCFGESPISTDLIDNTDDIQLIVTKFGIGLQDLKSIQINLEVIYKMIKMQSHDILQDIHATAFNQSYDLLVQKIIKFQEELCTLTFQNVKENYLRLKKVGESDFNRWKTSIWLASSLLIFCFVMAVHLLLEFETCRKRLDCSTVTIFQFVKYIHFITKIIGCILLITAIVLKTVSSLKMDCISNATTTLNVNNQVINIDVISPASKIDSRVFEDIPFIILQCRLKKIFPEFQNMKMAFDKSKNKTMETISDQCLGKIHTFIRSNPANSLIPNLTLISGELEIMLLERRITSKNLFVNFQKSLTESKLFFYTLNKAEEECVFSRNVNTWANNVKATVSTMIKELQLMTNTKATILNGEFEDKVAYGTCSTSLSCGEILQNLKKWVIIGSITEVMIVLICVVLLKYMYFMKGNNIKDLGIDTVDVIEDLPGVPKVSESTDSITKDLGIDTVDVIEDLPGVPKVSESTDSITKDLGIDTVDVIEDLPGVPKVSESTDSITKDLGIDTVDVIEDLPGVPKVSESTDSITKDLGIDTVDVIEDLPGVPKVSESTDSITKDLGIDTVDVIEDLPGVPKVSESTDSNPKQLRKLLESDLL